MAAFTSHIHLRLHIRSVQGDVTQPNPTELDREADRFAAQVPQGKVCMAAIQEHLLRHRRAPEVAAHEVVFDDSSTESATPAEARAMSRPIECEMQEAR